MKKFLSLLLFLSVLALPFAGLAYSTGEEFELSCNYKTKAETTVYNSAADNRETLDTLPENVYCIIIDSEGDFLRIRYMKDDLSYTGWVANGSLARCTVYVQLSDGTVENVHEKDPLYNEKIAAGKIINEEEEKTDTAATDVPAVTPSPAPSPTPAPAAQTENSLTFSAVTSSGVSVQVLTLGLSNCVVSMNGVRATLPTAQLVFSAALQEEAFAVVSANNGQLTLRETPSTKGKSLGKVDNGIIVVVLERENGHFTKVRVGEMEGYLLSMHLTFKSAFTGETKQAKVVMKEGAKKNQGVNVRLGAGTGTKDRISCQLNEGDTVTVLQTKDGWCEVEFDGRWGWIMEDFLQLQ